ncbi:hypothetical protein CQW23_27994 [Capsicum baccatum]|uniref:Leucine-rich repeat-containing N-terminal plant-type domain-containing protein n=1 Tax=Capsicum baccatum TaxID=33114 RepID=A0A2G2VFC7_CAPBA|nr:hypothetical protein CQW23_27994 [Capsicum baccatum]
MLYPVLCQLAFSSSLPHLCPKDQAHALLQFKHMFTINPNSSHCYNPTTLSWNKSTDYCSWSGVHCDDMMGQVIELDLYYSGLQGKFHSNSSLFQLSNLKRLDLAGNDFSGCSFHLNLIILSSYMETVDLYGLRLEPYNFELLFKNVTQLRDLDLDFVNISSAIPLNFSSYLTSLWLPRTQLRGVLPERVFHLSYLSLSSYSLTGPIPSNVSGLQNLQALFLSSNYLNGTITSWIFSLPSLMHLNLSNNSFSGKIQEFKSKTLYSVVSKQNQL